MAHPLDGALAHISRADRDFLELHGILQPYLDSHKNFPIKNHERDKVMQLLTNQGQLLPVSFSEIPVDVPILVSAIIHHLRAALDYLIYELALYDSSGVAQEGTQFLIEDVKSDPKKPKRGFEYRKTIQLIGLSPAHIDAIENLQPYNGRGMLAVLRDISNPDKHRKLTVISSKGSAWAEGVSYHRSGDIEGGPNRIIGKSLSSDREIYVHTNASIDVVFPERKDFPVLETLEALIIEVRSVIETFKPEFK